MAKFHQTRTAIVDEADWNRFGCKLVSSIFISQIVFKNMKKRAENILNSTSSADKGGSKNL